MNEKPTILIVHNHYQLAGGEDTVVSNEKRMLEEHGHKVVLYTRSNSEIKSMNIFQKLLLPFISIYNPRTAKDIKKIIKEEDIDIVHVHNTLSLISPSVYYAALKMHKPVVQTIHNFRLLCPGATFYRNDHICEDCVTKGLRCSLKHKCYRNSFIQTLVCVINTKIHRATGIYSKINYICLTEFNKNKLLQLKQIKPEQVYVKPNFTYMSNDIKVENQNNQYVYVGRLEEGKGIKVLLEAWIGLPYKLVICGTGTLEEYCKNYIRENKLNVEMKGFLSINQVKEILSSSKALIVPSHWYEGFPMTILEAFSLNTPVICSDIGNVGDIVIDGKTGFKFETNNSKDLKNTILKFEHLSEEKITNIRKNIKEDYLKKYSMESNDKLLEDIYIYILT